MTTAVINHLADHGIFHARELKGKRIPAFVSSDLTAGGTVKRLARFERYLNANGAALVR